MKYLGQVHARASLRALSTLPVVAVVAYVLLRLADLVSMVQG